MIPKKLLDEITRWMRQGKYGNIQINFYGGRIENVKLSESLKVELLGSGIDSSSESVGRPIPIDQLSYNQNI